MHSLNKEVTDSFIFLPSFFPDLFVSLRFQSDPQGRSYSVDELHIEAKMASF